MIPKLSLYCLILLVMLSQTLTAACTTTAMSSDQPHEVMAELPPGDTGSRPSAATPGAHELPTGPQETEPDEQRSASQSSKVYLPSVHSSTQPPIRAIGVSYTNMAQSRPEVAALQAHASAAGVNMVGLRAGRPDWSYFRWQDHPEYWSSDVRSTGIDFLAEDSVNFASGHVDAVVDIYAPNYIAAHPEAAAISYWGEPSPLLVSTAALVSGPFHDLVLNMIEAIAANYAVDSISITELAYRIYGYGPDDLALYRAHSGRADWPRDLNGVILIDHPSVGAWRSAALAGFLAEAAAIAHAHGKDLFFDVSVSWGNLANEGREYGQDYALMLAAADRIIVWGFTDLAGYPPEYAGEIAAYLSSRYQPDQVIMSIGLWGPNGAVMEPTSMAAAAAAIQATSIPHIWVTPTSLMTAGHWQELTIP